MRKVLSVIAGGAGITFILFGFTVFYMNITHPTLQVEESFKYVLQAVKDHPLVHNLITL